MKRRIFLKSTALSSIAYGLGSSHASNKSHILTLSFDDGFKKSFYRIADLFEEQGLSACFNVIASGHFPDFKKVGDYILPELMGNFDDWNALRSRGHEVMPHSWKHLNLADQPLEKAQELIIKCLEYFQENLVGYRPEEAVFNFPFNASTPALEEFTLSKVMAIRASEIPDGDSRKNNVFRQGCRSHGPDNIDSWVEKQVDSFLASEGGWLILNLHGLDDEGWGPVSSAYLKELLGRLVMIESLELVPTGVVLSRSSGP